jgi:SAM-dependent methyltransferase
MKRFSELIEVETVINDSTDESNLNAQITEAIPNQEEIPDFPEYMIIESAVIGYESDSQQYSIYRSAEFGSILTGVETVLDIGCSRGDFGNFLLSRYPYIKYTGIDANELIIQVGKRKYSELYNSDNFNLKTDIFASNFQTDERYDYVYHINTLSIDYGIWPELSDEDNKYQYLKLLIEKSLEVCNIGVVFMLLNDTNDKTMYHTYSLDNVSKILYDMNLKFAIDNTDLSNMYKLVVLKQSF